MRTRPVAVYPSGREFAIYHRSGTWWWDQGKGSFPYSAAVENVEREGGRVERRPVAARSNTLTHELRRFLG